MEPATINHTPDFFGPRDCGVKLQVAIPLDSSTTLALDLVGTVYVGIRRRGKGKKGGGGKRGSTVLLMVMKLEMVN